MILAQIETVTSMSIISRYVKKQEKGSRKRQSEINLLLVFIDYMLQHFKSHHQGTKKIREER
jgi:hypothetical protein